MCYSDRKEWEQRGKKLGAKHIIVVCDTFSHEDYPVFVDNSSELPDLRRHYNGPNMQRVHEVIDL